VFQSNLVQLGIFRACSTWPKSEDSCVNINRVCFSSPSKAVKKVFQRALQRQHFPKTNSSIWIYWVSETDHWERFVQPCWIISCERQGHYEEPRLHFPKRIILGITWQWNPSISRVIWRTLGINRKETLAKDNSSRALMLTLIHNMVTHSGKIES